MQTDPEPPSGASLMGLPTELWQQIFEEALTATQDNHQPRLRGREDLDQYKIMPLAFRDMFENQPSGPSDVQIVDNA